jgi:multisubunit Na+/H+ antiporter MnhG subunit
MTMADREHGAAFTNGAALAAFLAAGIGALGLGLVVFLNELGVFEVPAIYEPAGGVTGRTAAGVGIWLVAWAVLHSRWKDRRMESSGLFAMSLILIAVGFVLCFPPVWHIF